MFSKIKKNIVLTGLMGSGKTSVGKLLAKKLNYKFIDTDQLIEEKAGMKIKDIFAQHGEPCFRRIEAQICKKVSSYKQCVISTGGGVVLDYRNIENLRKNGIIINLRAKPEILWQRVKYKKDRPLLKVEHPVQILKRIWVGRKPLYDDADIIIKNDKLTINATVDRIIKKLCK